MSSKSQAGKVLKLFAEDVAVPSKMVVDGAVQAS